MSQYAGTQQDEASGLVNNPRYQGQAGGTAPMGHDGRGPQQETRYGAAPLSTGNTTDPMETIRNPAAYGFKKNEPEGFRFPGTTGSQQQQQQQQHHQPGMVKPNVYPSQAGYGNQPRGVHGNPVNDADFAKEQPGYGEQGFGAPSEGQNTGSLWPHPATPPNAHKNDLAGQGYGGNEAGYGGNQAGYGGNEAGYGGNQAGNQAGYGGNQAGYGGNQPAGYDQSTQRGHGQGFNPNVNHPSEERGFGGGHGAQGYDQSQQLGDGYHTGMATGADVYGQPRPAGGDYDARTATGNDAYVHGNHPPGMQDRVEGVNEPTLLGGERIPESAIGERRTEPGYDSSKGDHHFPGHHQKLDGTGYADQSDTGLKATRLDNERRGKEFEDKTGTDRTGTGYDGTGTGTGTGYDGTGTGTGSGYDGTGTGTGTGYDATGSGYDDTTATGTAPPKKGLMTKIKEKLHH